MHNSPWPMVPLDTLLRRDRRPVEVKPTEEYAEIGIYCFGKGIFHKSPRTGFEVGNKKLFRIEEGDFILQITFAWEGAVALASKAENGMYGSTRFPTFRVDETRCYPPFLLNYFRTESGRLQLVKISPGSAGRNRVLSLRRFPEVFVPLPPLTEQRRIVARIERLAAKVEAARELREEATTEVESLWANVLRSNREKLLANFPSARLGKLTKITSGGTPSRKNPDYWHGHIPWIKSGELKDDEINDAEEYITQEAVDNSSAKQFPVDTVLVALYGQGQTRGRTALLKIEATTNQACCAILPTPESLLPHFTQYWLRSLYYEMREQVRDGAQPNWNARMIKNIQMAFPPLSEQRRIVAHLDALQAKLTAVQQHQVATQTRLDALLPSILDKAFRGEL